MESDWGQLPKYHFWMAQAYFELQDEQSAKDSLLNVKEKAKATGKLQAAVYGADGNSGESFTNMVNPSQPKGHESFHNIF